MSQVWHWQCQMILITKYFPIRFIATIWTSSSCAQLTIKYIPYVWWVCWLILYLTWTIIINFTTTIFKKPFLAILFTSFCRMFKRKVSDFSGSLWKKTFRTHWPKAIYSNKSSWSWNSLVFQSLFITILLNFQSGLWLHYCSTFSEENGQTFQPVL